MQQVWLLLLDDEFMEAYKHGILILCGNGILRRIFPRIFFYSADYPEKYVCLLRSIYVTYMCSDASLCASNAWRNLLVLPAWWIGLVSGRWE